MVEFTEGECPPSLSKKAVQVRKVLRWDKGSVERMQSNDRERIRNAKANSRGMLRLRAFGGGGGVAARTRYVEIIDS